MSVKIYDAGDRILAKFDWLGFMQLVAVEEMPGSPHVYRIYQLKSNPQKLTLIVRDKHLNRTEFNSIDAARDLLQKFTLKASADVAKIQQK